MYHVIFKARENKVYYNNFITMAKAFTNEEIIIAENEILSTGNPYLIYTFAIETEENGFDVERFRKELSNLGDSTYIKLFNNHFPKDYVENRRIKAIRECNEMNAKYIQEPKKTEETSIPQQIINHFENKLEDKKVKEINEKVNDLLKTDTPSEIYSFFLQNNKYFYNKKNRLKGDFYYILLLSRSSNWTSASASTTIDTCICIYIVLCISLAYSPNWTSICTCSTAYARITYFICHINYTS